MMMTARAESVRNGLEIIFCEITSLMMVRYKYIDIYILSEYESISEPENLLRSLIDTKYKVSKWQTPKLRLLTSTSCFSEHHQP